MSQTIAASTGFLPAWLEIRSIAGSKHYIGALRPECKSDFQALIAEQRTKAKEDAVQREAQADNPDRPPLLSEEEFKALADRYDSSDMSQEDYEALFDELCGKGIFSPEDKDMMGLGPSGLVKLDWGSIGTASCVPMGQDHGSFFPAEGGDLLSFARYQASFRFMDPVSGSWFKTKPASLYETLADILEQMRTAA